MRKPFYQPERYYTPRAERKWISRYTLEGEELQNLVSQNQSVLYTEILDLSVAQSFFNPKILNVPGRAIALYGIQSGTEYNPKTNSGIETVASDPFVFIRLNHQDLSNGYALKHTRGLRCDFSQSFLSWPAQPSVKARLVIYKFDQHPWQTGVSSWPNGADGGLHIFNGQNISLSAGAIKNYSSVTIDLGGVLEVTDNGISSIGNPVVIGSRGLFTLNGVLKFITNRQDGTFTTLAPDGVTFSYTVQRVVGGPGGSAAGQTGGAPFGPNGGGGASGQFNGNDATAVLAGDGANGEDGFGPVPGGGGTNNQSFPGDPGTSGNGPGGDGNCYGGGGGGGFGGYNGGGIYINAAGGCAGNGVILIDGSDASGGGDGGGADGAGFSNLDFGGGGGGAGSGGCGGKVLVRYHGAAPLWTVSKLAGNIQNPGNGGLAINAGGADVDGTSGGAGQAGNVGSSSFVAY